MILFLTEDGHDGITVLIYGSLVRRPDEEASAACGRIIQSPLLGRHLTDIANADKPCDDTGHLTRRVELSLALAGLLRKLHHKILVSIADDVIAAGAVVFEVNRRILEYGNQAGYLIDQFLAGAKFVWIVEADIGKGTLESVVFKELLDNLVHPFADITLSLGSNQILKGRSFADGKLSKRLTLISVGHIFEEQQNKHIILVPRRFHAAPQFIASLPKERI